MSIQEASVLDQTGMKKILIGGKWVEGEETFSVTAPYGGEKIADVASAGTNDMAISIEEAQRAAKIMQRLPRFELARGLRRLAALIEERRNEFARTITQESAKPISLSRGEVERAVATFAWAAGEAERFAGDVVPVDTQPIGRGKTAWTLKIPRGVIYGITPFNFPLNLVAHKVAPALASRNSIIIKPSPRTPLTALLLGEAFLDSGLPASALQVVPMDVRHIGTVLSSEKVKMISFTGSADVGWELKRNAGKKFITLELGGNASVIVDKNADKSHSLSRTLTGAFAYSGQVCISVQRVYVHSSIYENWLNEFVELAKGQITGDPMQEQTRLSVMIDENAAARAESWINEAREGGANIICGGNRTGSMLEATVLTNTDPEMKIVSEEAFAPLVVVESFSDFEQAVEMANQGRFGLQAGVFTSDLGNANYAAENLDYGSVIINDVPTFRVDNMPYGGTKDSGFGREGVRYAMEEMTESRLIVMS